jgi:hypothetical protein
MKLSEFTKFKIARRVEELFARLPARYGDNCKNPVTGAGFIYGEDPIEPQKEEARRILFKIEHFALNGPADAQPLRPVLYDQRKEPRKERWLLDYIVRLYARSLEERDPDEHPSFADYASGVLWETERDASLPSDDQTEELKKRFPPRKLAGIGPGFCWLPPERYKKWVADQRRAARRARAASPIPTTQASLIDELVVVPESVRRAAAQISASKNFT